MSGAVNPAAKPGTGARLVARARGLQGQALASVMLKAAGAALALALQWAVARLYGASGSGLFGLMATTVTLIGVVAVWGQDYLVLRNVSGDLAEGRHDLARGNFAAALHIVKIGTILGTVATAFASLLYASWLDQPELGPMLLWALPVCAGLAVGRLYAFTARAGGSLILSQVPDGPLTSAIALAVIVGLLASGTSVGTWAMGAAYGIAYLGALIFSVWLGRNIVRSWPTKIAAVTVAPLAAAGLPITIASATPFLTDWLVMFATTAYHGADTGGQVRIVMLFIMAMFLVTIAFDAVLAGPIAGAFRLGDTAKVWHFYRLYAFGSAALTLPLLAGALLIPELLLAPFGSEFVSAATALRSAVALQFVTIVLGPAGTVLIMANREKSILIVNLVGTVFLALACVTLIPRYGALGGALTAAGTLFVKRATEIVLAWRHLHFRPRS